MNSSLQFRAMEELPGEVIPVNRDRPKLGGTYRDRIFSSKFSILLLLIPVIPVIPVKSASYAHARTCAHARTSKEFPESAGITGITGIIKQNQWLMRGRSWDRTGITRITNDLLQRVPPRAAASRGARSPEASAHEEIFDFGAGGFPAPGMR